MEQLNAKCVRRASVEGAGGSIGSVTRTMRIINEIPYPIGIASREGLKYDLPSSNNLSLNSLIVQVRYDLSKTSRDTLETLLCSSSVENSPELQLVKQAFAQDKLPPPFSRTKFDIEYVITEKELLDHGGLIYIRDLDLVISSRGCTAIKYHPYSREASLYAFSKESFNDDNSAYGNNFIYTTKLIDNFGQIGKRWLRIGSDVVELTPIKDEALSDGIYVATRKPSINNLGNSTNLIERYDVDQETPYFKIYRHFHEARHTVDDEMKMKIAEFENKRIKMETDLTISQNRLDSVTQEAELLRNKIAIDEKEFAQKIYILDTQLKLAIKERDNMYVKDKYESISADRKNTIELVKVVPAIVLGLIGVIAAAQKVMK